MNQDDIRALALSLPEAEEHPHFDRASFRVRGKIFATLPEDGRTANLKTTPIGLDMLLRHDERTYRDVWGGRWVGVELSRADPDELCELLLEAYCLAAPKTLGKAARATLRSPVR